MSTPRTQLHFVGSVSLDDVHGSISAIGIPVCLQVFELHQVYAMWITSLYRRGIWGLHPKGKAFDIRVSNIPVDKRQPIVNMLKQRLAPAFDVVYGTDDPDGEHWDHIHVEYDPD